MFFLGLWKGGWSIPAVLAAGGILGLIGKLALGW